MQGFLATLLALVAGAVADLAALAAILGLLSLLSGYRYGTCLAAYASGILCGVSAWVAGYLLFDGNFGAALIITPILLMLTLVVGAGTHTVGRLLAAMRR